MTFSQDPVSSSLKRFTELPADRSLALLFPGQGSQKVGMGMEAHRASNAAREVFEYADSILGDDLSRICFEGPEAELTRTANAQPAILTTSVALFAAAIESGALDATARGNGRAQPRRIHGAGRRGRDFVRGCPQARARTRPADGRGRASGHRGRWRRLLDWVKTK